VGKRSFAFSFTKEVMGRAIVVPLWLIEGGGCGKTILMLLKYKSIKKYIFYAGIYHLIPYELINQVKKNIDNKALNR
jgi:hypothetical protein